ncbi:hypothetical protein BKA69DRAFT_777026 [Paraphysoderma sedebokerense]|nr:hypothetical protein BKA69DRAFT_777026 [Paraphysoderma sedebokerense]
MYNYYFHITQNNHCLTRFCKQARSYIPVSESKLNASNRSELTNITGSLQTQVSKAKQTSQDLDHLKSAFNQINETVSSLASATSAPNQIVPSPNDLMKQLELLKSQIQGVQTKVASLENSGGSATSNELKKEFEKYQSNMKALEKQMAELTSEVMGVKESSSQTAELTLSVSQSTANLPQLTNEVEKLNGTISELQKEKEFLESEVEVVKKLARVVNEELDEMKLENKKLKGIVEDLEGWKKSVAKDMEVVEKERKEVKQSLNELKKHTRRPRRSFLSTLFFTLSTTFLVSSLSFYVVKYTPLPSYVESKTGLKMQGVVDRMDQVVGAVVGGLAGGIGSVVGQWESSQAGTVGGNGAWVREKQNVNSDESVDGDSNAGKASKKVKVKGNKNDQGSTSKEAVVEQVKVEL